MNSYGASGYVMSLYDFLVNLVAEEEAERIENLETTEEIWKEVIKIIHSGIPEPDVFMLQEEDNAANLTTGVWYVCWQDEDIWERKYSKGFEAIKKLCGEPVFEHWSVWG